VCKKIFGTNHPARSDPRAPSPPRNLHSPQPNKTNVATTITMPSIYDDSGDALRKSDNNNNGTNDDAGGVDYGGDDRSKVCGIFCDAPRHDDASCAGGTNGPCFDNPILNPLCHATLSSVDQITCGGVQGLTNAGGGGLPHDRDDGPLEKLFRFRPSYVMGDYFTRVGSGGSMMQRHKDEGGMETTTTTTESTRMKERRGGGGKATAALLRRTYPLSSYNGEAAAPMGPTKCEYCAAESTMECTSNLPREYNALFMGSTTTTTTTTTTICKNISSTTRVCHRPKLFFLKKRPPFATMDGWNPITEYRINLFEPPTTMEGMDRGWGEVRGHLGDKSSNNTNYNNTAAGGGDFSNGNYGNIGTASAAAAAAAAAADAAIDKEGGRGGSSKSTIETASTVRAGYSTNSINDNSEGGGGGGGGNGGGSGRTMSSSPVQWAWSRLMGGALTPKSSKDFL